MLKRIYLDNNATTALDPVVLEVMLKELTDLPSNPSSTHFFGQRARQRLLHAREETANFFGFRPSEVIFTSSGSEAMNLLIRGSAAHLPKGEILSSNIEHPSVYHTLQDLESQGWKIRYLPVGQWGGIRAEQVEASITSATRLLVFSAANSETGVKNEVVKIARCALQNDLPLIVDGVGWLGKEPLIMHEGITGIGFSAHKIHGPMGVGVALARSRLRLSPLITGGAQEYGRRAGTENLAGIVGLAAALRQLRICLAHTSLQMANLRDQLEFGLVQNCGAMVNGQGPRISNTLNVSFPHADGETLLIQLDMAGIAVSHGSACSSGALEPSRILLNMGISRELARSSIRFSLSRLTTQEEIDRCLEVISRLVAVYT